MGSYKKFGLSHEMGLIDIPPFVKLYFISTLSRALSELVNALTLARGYKTFFSCSVEQTDKQSSSFIMPLWPGENSVIPFSLKFVPRLDFIPVRFHFAKAISSPTKFS